MPEHADEPLTESQGKTFDFIAGEVRDLDSGYVTFEERWPHYFSTYCIHGHHDDCRLTCKVCDAKCRCECHA